MTYERVREKQTRFTFETRERETERFIDDEDDRDPHPSLPPLRVVVADGECVDETTRPLSKCRQITPAPMKRVLKAV